MEKTKIMIKKIKFIYKFKKIVWEQGLSRQVTYLDTGRIMRLPG